MGLYSQEFPPSRTVSSCDDRISSGKALLVWPVWEAACMVKAVLMSTYFFAKSEISKFEMPFCSDENVVWLNVSMNIVHFVHFFNGDDELSDVEAGLCLSKDVLFNEQAQQVASRHPFHSNIEVISVLEGSF